MKAKTVALLHPGKMGATIGAAVGTGGARVVWASHERSKATRERAKQAGLVDLEDLSNALHESEIVFSVCPPEAALAVAQSVERIGFRGIYVDANAISRFTAVEIGATVSRSGASFVDGAIIGPPVVRSGTTRLYLSGARAREVAELFSGSWVDARTAGEEPGAASALKVVYAAWTKCTDALILAIRALAAIEGVDKTLAEEWAISQPDLERRSVRAAAVATPKAWRYVGEMREIAATFAAAGLPSGFHEAAAEICDRLALFKDRTEPPLTIAEVVDWLRATSKKRGSGSFAGSCGVRTSIEIGDAPKSK